MNVCFGPCESVTVVCPAPYVAGLFPPPPGPSGPSPSPLSPGPHGGTAQNCHSMTSRQTVL